MNDTKVLKAADETKNRKNQTSTSKDGVVCKNLGGVTTIRFEEKGKNTEILKQMSPD
ncbi:hypothetical protein [Leptospira yasudae]|uniref:hypothetical protein n=1 Tax=Leptospira yasudae TaxID=2202201 RepID=UPI0013146A48|nr:hypothetical protein [Leptospira yasudae]